MNVLFVAPRFGEHAGGDGLYAVTLARGLVARGVRVSVLTIAGERFVLGIPAPAGSPESPLTVQTALERIPRNELSKNFYSLAARESMTAALTFVQPMVIHFHGLHQYFTVSSLGPVKRSGAPTLLTVHDYKLLCGNAGFFSDRSGQPCLKCLKGGFLPPIGERCKRGSLVHSIGASAQMGLWLSAGILRTLTRVHAGSEFVGNLLRQNAALEQKVVVRRFPPMLSHQWTPGNRQARDNIVYMGRMVPHKGVGIFAEAVKNIDRRIDVFGDGPQMEDARRILSGHPRAVFHGWAAHETIRDYLQEGTLVILPYLAHETFCFAVLEAMVRGCCVITTSRGAIPELVRDGVSGYCIDNPTPEEFRKVVAELSADPERVKAIGRNAREVLQGLGSLEEHSSAMETLYRSLPRDRG